MKPSTTKEITVLGFLLAAQVSAAELGIVTTIPDLADIASEIGREHVSVFSLARGTEDYHLIQSKSSFLPKLNRARLVISLGLEAESRWLEPIVQNSRNIYVQRGNPGWIEVYKNIAILEKPADTAAAVGHRHGNPHFNTGPYCGKYMARDIFEALVREDPVHKNRYTENYRRYIAKLDTMEIELRKKSAPLNGVHVITFHADLAYFCNYYGMVLTGCLEPAPGIAPNPGHLARLAEQAVTDSVRLILYHQAQNRQLPEKMARSVGAKTVCFANMVGARKEIRSFIGLQVYNLDLMLAALAQGETR
ncbi:MAG: metal ABC transporter substrate-binding protein [Chitinispirillaceae bacterium]|jgi:zinc/manganese transport system substrate-binding protein|nr:metal ABC transporter substrate-binding protein [Chitinispirillaceae bacterium]